MHFWQQTRRAGNGFAAQVLDAFIKHLLNTSRDFCFDSKCDFCSENNICHCVRLFVGTIQRCSFIYVSGSFFQWELVHWKLQASLLSETVTFNVSKKTGCFVFRHASRQADTILFFFSHSPLPQSVVPVVQPFTCLLWSKQQRRREGEKPKSTWGGGRITKILPDSVTQPRLLVFNEKKLVRVEQL